MTSHRTTLLLAAATAVAISANAQAEGLYGTGMLGLSFQATDSEPYGSNIAVDPDFPSQFNTGERAVGALGFGYDFNGPFRVEGRLGLHQADFNSQRFGTGARAGEEYILNGDIESTTLTVEGFYDIPTDSVVKPYVKAGVGAARNTYSARLGGAGVAAFDPFDGTVDGFYDAYPDQTSAEFSWNVGIGASVPLNDQVILFGEYQYVSFGDASTGHDAFTDGFRVDASAHELMLGVRVGF